MKNIRIIFTLLFVFLLIVAGMVWNLSRLQSNLIKSTAIRAAELHSVALTQFRKLYTSEVVARAKALGLEATHDYASRNDTIPLPATLTIKLGEEISKYTDGARILLYSPYPFPWRIKENKTQHSGFENDAWNFLVKHPDQAYTRFDKVDSGAVFRYATADIMQPQCVACHNNHADTPKNNWKVGDVRGVLSISLPLDDIVSQTEDDLRSTSIAYLFIGLGIALVFGMVISKLRQQSQELQYRVAEQTAGLERSNRELESYSYSIAHDLRAPLRSITGFSQILQEDAGPKLNAEEKEHFERIINASKRMAELIDDILQLGRVTRNELHRTEVDLTALAKASVERVCLVGESRQIDWQIQEGLTIFGDDRLLALLLDNLLGNAYKYSSKETHACIEFGSACIDGSLSYFVKDNGVGFDMKYAGQLFTPFHRLHARGDFDGSGVGLATVQRIIDRHGGRVWVEAEVNVGATFYFTLFVPCGT